MPTTDEIRRKLLENVLAAAVDVCAWSWDDIDEEPSADMTALQEAVEKYNNFVEAEDSVSEE